MRRTATLLLLLLVAACNRGGGLAERAREAHAEDSAHSRTGGDTVEAAAAGVELEAPRLIPGLRAQLAALSDSGAGFTEGNVTAYRNLAGDVIDAMLTDLNRAGSPEAPQIDRLGDSVVTLLGGGAGGAAIGTREEVSASVRLMGRLIEQYQSAMRAARP